MSRVLIVRGIGWLWVDRGAEEPHVVVVILESGTVGVRAPWLTAVGWSMTDYGPAAGEVRVMEWTRRLESERYALIGSTEAVVHDPCAGSLPPGENVVESCFDPLLDGLQDAYGVRLEPLPGLLSPIPPILPFIPTS